ncbi:peptidoglycan D,D-transpeptidase FtsI family protein [Corynebacterium uterequi]|uniref:Cell division protein FtsI/penicillin-binding protein 2 n=1 Tax=Corynebacterium uterequi TaxID=1072256 RepID=A0A0G3HDS5_9CORY|nr:penicillin-binding protein 2 [Corynebacterium uterequi]AKK11464.1 cell division protein FtsI/penicillin-binding protein 2 [Corynebacterium uterequi]
MPYRTPRQRPHAEPKQAVVLQHRSRIAVMVLFAIVVVLIGRLALVQLIWGPEFSSQAEEQRARYYSEPARRGAIVDHDGSELAYTMMARSLTVSPNMLRKELAEQQRQLLNVETDTQEVKDGVAEILNEMATEIPKMISDTGASTDHVNSREIRDKLAKDSSYEVLVRNVDPEVAHEIATTFHGVASDHQSIRMYPNGMVGENIVGKVSMDGIGQFGLEASADETLAGVNGQSTEDVSADGVAIPGTLRDVVDVVDGTDIKLTLDLELQTFVQRELEDAKRNSMAEHAEAVVLDAQTGHVLAMANTDTMDPNGDIAKQAEAGKHFDNSSISHPYEPGSVAKIITAAAAINDGLTTPDEVHTVPGSIEMAGVTVGDAWEHGDALYTTTGIFGKSSNVGTLMLAQRLGEERYDHYLDLFGIGQPTNIHLPAESPGLRPDFEDWGGGTFANLPIGQGMSWTSLQLASVYQTIANGGVRIEPRIVDSFRDPQGKLVAAEPGRRTRVVSPEAARTVLNMFRATLQADGEQSGTAAGSGIEGYQTSGKTGTAQQVDPQTGAYSHSDYWITFAGIAPADDPRFVVAIMLDDPERGTEAGGAGGQSAAPVFHDIASWLLDRENIAPSPPAEPLVLQR